MDPNERDDRIKALLKWARSRGIWIDERLEIRRCDTVVFEGHSADAVEDAHDGCYGVFYALQPSFKALARASPSDATENEEDEGMDVDEIDFITAGTVLVKIPKTAILSVRTSSFADVFGPAAAPDDGRGRPVDHIEIDAHTRSQFRLAMVLYAELLLGDSSPFFPYLASLPGRRVSLATFWLRHESLSAAGEAPGNENPDVSDFAQARVWMRGTQLERELTKPETAVGKRLLRALEQYYHRCVVPLMEVLANKGIQAHATLASYEYVFSLVSSRAFLVDAFHGLAMVPIADMFNHHAENHVQMQSDYEVCRECGSVDVCVHDEETYAANSSGIEVSTDRTEASGENTCDMVSEVPILAGGEIFNTFGAALTNAQLLVRYGFALTDEGNENDVLRWYNAHEVLGWVLERSPWRQSRNRSGKEDDEKAFWEEFVRARIRWEDESEIPEGVFLVSARNHSAWSESSSPSRQGAKGLSCLDQVLREATGRPTVEEQGRGKTEADGRSDHQGEQAGKAQARASGVFPAAPDGGDDHIDVHRHGQHQDGWNLDTSHRNPNGASIACAGMHGHGRCGHASEGVHEIERRTDSPVCSGGARDHESEISRGDTAFDDEHVSLFTATAGDVGWASILSQRHRRLIIEAVDLSLDGEGQISSDLFVLCTLLANNEARWQSILARILEKTLAGLHMADVKYDELVVLVEGLSPRAKMAGFQSLWERSLLKSTIASLGDEGA